MSMQASTRSTLFHSRDESLQGSLLYDLPIEKVLKAAEDRFKILDQQCLEQMTLWRNAIRQLYPLNHFSVTRKSEMQYLEISDKLSAVRSLFFSSAKKIDSLEKLTPGILQNVEKLFFYTKTLKQTKPGMLTDLSRYKNMYEKWQAYFLKVKDYFCQDVQNELQKHVASFVEALEPHAKAFLEKTELPQDPNLSWAKKYLQSKNLTSAETDEDYENIQKAKPPPLVHKNPPPLEALLNDLDTLAHNCLDLFTQMQLRAFGMQGLSEEMQMRLSYKEPLNALKLSWQIDLLREALPSLSPGFDKKTLQDNFKELEMRTTQLNLKETLYDHELQEALHYYSRLYEQLLPLTRYDQCCSHSNLCNQIHNACSAYLTALQSFRPAEVSLFPWDLPFKKPESLVEKIRSLEEPIAHKRRISGTSKKLLFSDESLFNNESMRQETYRQSYSACTHSLLKKAQETLTQSKAMLPDHSMAPYQQTRDALQEALRLCAMDLENFENRSKVLLNAYEEIKLQYAIKTNYFLQKIAKLFTSIYHLDRVVSLSYKELLSQRDCYIEINHAIRSTPLCEGIQRQLQPSLLHHHLLIQKLTPEETPFSPALQPATPRFHTIAPIALNLKLPTVAKDPILPLLTGLSNHPSHDSTNEDTDSLLESFAPLIPSFERGSNGGSLLQNQYQARLEQLAQERKLYERWLQKTHTAYQEYLVYKSELNLLFEAYRSILIRFENLDPYQDPIKAATLHYQIDWLKTSIQNQAISPEEWAQQAMTAGEKFQEDLTKALSDIALSDQILNNPNGAKPSEKQLVFEKTLYENTALFLKENCRHFDLCSTHKKEKEHLEQRLNLWAGAIGALREPQIASWNLQTAFHYALDSLKNYTQQ